MALNKVLLQKYYNNLDGSFSEYMTAYRQWKNGSNITKRNAGFEDAEF